MYSILFYICGRNKHAVCPTVRSLKGVLNDILMVSGQTSGMTRLRDNQPCQETFRQERKV